MVDQPKHQFQLMNNRLAEPVRALARLDLCQTLQWMFAAGIRRV
jgi:hypothetical protein